MASSQPSTGHTTEPPGLNWPDGRLDRPLARWPRRRGSPVPGSCPRPAARLQDNHAMLETIDGFPADPVRLGPPPDEAEGRHVQSIEPAIRTELEGGHLVWWLPRRAHLGDPAQRLAARADDSAAHQV